MRGFRSALRCLTVVCALLPAVGLNAGRAQEPQWTEMMIMQVHPGMAFEFEDFLKSDVFPAMRKGGATEWGGWRIHVGDSGEYIFTAPLASLAQRDQPGPLIKALGLDGMKTLLGRMHKYVGNTRACIYMGRSDLGIEPATGYVPKLGFQVRVMVPPGRNQDYERWIKGVMGVIKNTSARGAYAGQIFFGGNPGEYHSLILFDAYADIDRFGPAFSKGMEAANIPSPVGFVDKMEYRIYEYVPELSQPAPAR
ncbi:MAG: hypothetical protein JW793_00270 [Acidobacteria bacterium]|nr:hypothetical protein [Acidobacteriota bacterium]